MPSNIVLTSDTASLKLPSVYDYLVDAIRDVFVQKDVLDIEGLLAFAKAPEVKEDVLLEVASEAELLVAVQVEELGVPGPDAGLVEGHKTVGLI